MTTKIDQTAIVGKQAQLGEGVEIGPYSIIEDGAVIGDGTTIAAHVVIHKWTTLGKELKIASFAAIGGAPQDLKYRGEPTMLEVGDRCDIREYVTMNRGTVDSGKTVVGSDCLFMANSHVAHDCIVGSHCILANSAALGGHVELGDWVIIGGLVPVHQFTHIGEHAIVGGGFRTVKDVPPYICAGNVPLSFGGLNSIGLRRRGFSVEAIENIRMAYHLLYGSNLNVSQAIAKIKEQLPLTPEIQNILTFIAKSKRGLIGGPRHRD